MNVVCNLMDQNAFGGIRIAVVSQQVFFTTGAIRVAFAPPGSAGSGIPEILGRKPLHIGPGGFSLAKACEFRQVSREFVMSDDAQPGPTADHGLQNIRPSGQHHVDQVLGFFQCIGVDVFRRNDGEAIRAGGLRVESRCLVRSFGVEPEPLNRDFAGDNRF